MGAAAPWEVHAIDLKGLTNLDITLSNIGNTIWHKSDVALRQHCCLYSAQPQAEEVKTQPLNLGFTVLGFRVSGFVLGFFNNGELCYLNGGFNYGYRTDNKKLRK